MAKVMPSGIAVFVLNVLKMYVTIKPMIKRAVLPVADAMPMFSWMVLNESAEALAKTRAEPMNIGIIAIIKSTMFNLTSDVNNNSNDEERINKKPIMVALRIDI